jgi:hypothetical protein
MGKVPHDATRKIIPRIRRRGNIFFKFFSSRERRMLAMLSAHIPSQRKSAPLLRWQKLHTQTIK